MDERAVLIDERFEVIETLGRGGMGVVYGVFDRERGVPVALKTLRGVTPESVLRFKTEFRALRDVRAPNLVELGELFESDGNWYFTMELVRGTAFLDWVRAGGEAPASTGAQTQPAPSSYAAAGTPEASEASARDTGDATGATGATQVDAPASVRARIATAKSRRLERRAAPSCDVDRLRNALGGLARGLAALHAAGKVHRDIKPSNLLVDDDGRVVVLDFGIVAELHHAEKKLVLGTVRYMAPEQARGEPVGPPADWYAMGVLAFRALTGELPYGDVSHDELLVLKQHVDAPAPSALADGIPRDLDELVVGLLARDPAMRPGEAEIFDTLRLSRGSAPVFAFTAADPVFVGRDDELDALDAALAASRDAATVVLVTGESGVGKSAVVAAFVAGTRATDRRFLVLRGRCHEREHVPFNALDGVVDDLARWLRARREASVTRVVPADVAALLAVFPSLRAVRAFADAAALERTLPRDVRTRAFAALRSLLAKTAARRAVAIVLEDLQWADADSLALVDELVRAPDAPHACVIATLRLTGRDDTCAVETLTRDPRAVTEPEGAPANPHARDPITRRLVASGACVRTIALAGLPLAEITELVRRLGDATDATRIARIHAETAGHPLFVRELARRPAGEPVRLDDAIRARVDRLDPAAARLLAAIAIAGAPIPRHLAIAAAGLAAGTAEPHVAALQRDQLARCHGPRPVDPIEPFHDRVREAVCARLSPDDARALALALARALEVAGAPPTTLLARFEAAGDRERSAHYVVLAAEAARAAFAFGRAAALYERALAAAPDRRVALLVALAECLANDGRTGEAAERYREAAALEPADSERQLDLLRLAAERFLMSGRVDDGLATARSVLARADMRLPATRAGTIAGIVWNQLRMRGRALAWRAPPAGRHSLDAEICWSVGAGLGMIDTLLGAYFSGRAARFALGRGSAHQIARGMSAAAIGACVLGRRGRARRLVDLAVAAADHDGSPHAHWYVTLARTGFAFLIDNDFARAHTSALALETEWYASGHGPGWETDVALHFCLASQMMLGDHRALAARVATLVRNARDRGDLFQEVTLRVRFGFRHLLDDDPDAARADLADALARWQPGADSFGNQRAWALWSRARVALYTTTVDPALDDEWRRMHRALIGRAPVMQLEWLQAYGACLLLRGLAGGPRDRSAACAAADRVADRYRRLAFPAAPAAEAMLRAAVVWHRDGDRVGALRHAIERCRAAGVGAYLPLLELRLGQALGGEDGARVLADATAAAHAAGWTAPLRAAHLVIPT